MSGGVGRREEGDERTVGWGAIDPCSSSFYFFHTYSSSYPV
jgi:hypothetical protein